MSSLLLTDIRSCQRCKQDLPLPPNPIIQFSTQARIQIIGQAPGLATHKVNRPFKDKSGDRLRDWLAISEQDFYNPSLLAITPMAFCYPGKNKSGSGDAAPPKRCYSTWHHALNNALTSVQLRILIGSYAAKAYLPQYTSLNQAIVECADQTTVVLPHPSPRNNIWLKKNDWFVTSVLPRLRERVAGLIAHK